MKQSTAIELEKTNRLVVLPSLLSSALSTLFIKKPKVHDYSNYQVNKDYVFDSAESPSRGYMTAQGKGIRRGDYILLKGQNSVESYRVEEVDYYSNPSDMWSALLIKVS